MRPAALTRARLLCLLAALASPSQALADSLAENLSTLIPVGDVVSKAGETLKPIETGVDAAHRRISQSVLTTAKWLDRFFDKDIYKHEENRTRVEVRAGIFTEDGGGLRFPTGVNMKLVLPGLNNKVHLLLSDREREEETGAGAEETRRLAAVRYFAKATRENNISFDTGLDFYNFVPIVFGKARYRKTHDIWSWTTRFTQWLKWYSDDGFEVQTRFDVERKFHAKYFFRTSLNGQWFHGKTGYYYHLGFLLFHPLDADQALEYEWSNHFATAPNNRLEEITLRVKYRRRIWRKWLYMEIAPQTAFRRTGDFEPIPGLFFGLEIDFGYIRQ